MLTGLSSIRRARHALTAAAVAACAGFACAQPSADPDPATPYTQADLDRAARLTGRDLGGIRLPIQAVRGDIILAAQRATVWREEPRAGVVGLAQPSAMHRMLLEGEVYARIGDYEFRSRRGVVWIQRIEGEVGAPDAPADEPPMPVYQVFLYLQDTGSYSAEAGLVLAADYLPVRAVVATPDGVRLRADRFIQGRPDDPLVTRGEGVVADYLRSLFNLPTSRDVEARRRLEEQERILRERETRPRVAINRAERPADAPPPPPRVARAAPPPVIEAVPARPTVPPRPPREPTEPAPVPAPLPRPVDEPPATTPPVAPATPRVPDEPTRAAPPLVVPGPVGEPPAGAEPIFARSGLIAISAGAAAFVAGASEDSIIISEGVALQYTDTRKDRVLEIQAQRAVIFLEPGRVSEVSRMGVEDVRGIYLEGDVVASDGRYTLRGPQIFYDIRRNKAVVVDAVFWTLDERRRLPVYVRADAIRQHAADEFSAERARLSTTSFFEPDFTIGARTVRITRRPPEPADDRGAEQEVARGVARIGGPGPEGGLGLDDTVEESERTYIDARGITMRARGVPFFFWPRYRGDPSEFPLRDLRVENSNASGAAIRTQWNLYSLLGLSRSDTTDANLLLDYYFDRGPAVGADVSWRDVRTRGHLFTYLVADDTGTDLLKSGAKVDRDGGARGMITADQRWKIDDRWTITAEASYIGDPAFIDAFFEREGETRREFTTQLLLSRRDENTLLNIQAKGNLNDFLANEYLLLSQGYSVNKLPEITYFRQGDDLLEEIAPGLLTWTSEYRAGRMALSFDESFARERGLRGDAGAQRAFGVNANQRIAQRLHREGYTEQYVGRLDTRHELASQLAAGPVFVTPFVVGRVTAYDNEFASFSPDEDDNMRLWGSVGVRIATTFHRIDESVHSRFFDLNEIRHIVEPGVTFVQSGTNIKARDLPVYDDSVESLVEGGQARVGVRQTWQTKRGKGRRQYVADVLRLDTDVVFASGDVDLQSPIRRFYDPRPELSQPGNYLDNSVIWQTTDALAVTAHHIYDFDSSKAQRWSVGMLIDHGPAFSAFAEMRTIASQDARNFDIGAQYQLTPKYTVGAVSSYNFRSNDFQSVSFTILRRSAAVLFGADVNYDTITGDTSIGFLIRPVGTRGQGRIGGQSSRFGG